MSASPASTQSSTVHAGARPVEALRTVVLCDLADATALVESLGDQRSGELFRRHDRLARELVGRHGGREMDKTDGFLLLFERPLSAVRFALDYHRGLRALSEAENVLLQARVGIHVGEVLLWANPHEDVAQGAKPTEVGGLTKAIAARTMGLALPGQTLVTGVAHALVQRSVAEMDPTAAIWRFHGRYSFKGVSEPVPIHEVGDPRLAPLQRPPSGPKAWRAASWWRRPRVLGMQALALALAGLIAALIAARERPAIAFAERDWVVVGDLRNLTDEPLYDEGLETAFRIALEQSRHVNLVSDLKVRDTLSRMEREPATAVDREIGAEVAIREGARALILPTVAEIGGRLRVSAEVVDPVTQTTVYAESAESEHGDAAIASAGRLAASLRARLGETLAAIDRDSVPLPEATTDSLEALRAYALASHHVQESRFAAAIQLFEEALRLDSEFGLARLGLVRTYMSSDDYPRAAEQLALARPLRDRMPPRDALYLDAFDANFRSTEEALQKWRLLVDLYPDDFRPPYNFAVFAWTRANRFRDAITVAEAARSPHDPTLASTLLALALFHAGMEDFERANALLAEIDTVGKRRPGWVWTAVLAAQERLDEAQDVLSRIQTSGVATGDIHLRVMTTALAVDRGNWPQALDVAARAVTEGDRIDAISGRWFRLMALALALKDPGASTRASELVPVLEAALAAADGAANGPDRETALVQAHYAAWLALRAGHAVDVDAVHRARRSDDERRFPLLTQLATLVRAQAAIAANRPTEVLAPLEAHFDGHELFALRIAHADALAAIGRGEEARAAARWLAEHRGRAYAEHAIYPALRPLAILESRLASLRLARLAPAGARGDDARTQAIGRLRAAWPQESTWPPFVREAVAALDARRPPP